MPPAETRSSSTMPTSTTAATTSAVRPTTMIRRRSKRSAIWPVDQRQAEGRQEFHQPDEAELEGAAGQVIDLPAQRHALHGEPHRGQEGRGQIAGEIAVAKGGKPGAGG